MSSYKLLKATLGFPIKIILSVFASILFSIVAAITVIWTFADESSWEDFFRLLRDRLKHLANFWFSEIW